MEAIRTQTVSNLMRVRVMQPDDVERLEEERRQKKEQELLMSSRTAHVEVDDDDGGTVKRDGDKIGRNTPCPCGSGQKYKKCCGKTS
jgi:preprotein translocase subunit SecA